MSARAFRAAAARHTMASARSTTEGMGDMGALDDLTKKAQDFVEENKDTINDALNSQQAEDISDKVLDAVSDAAKKVTPDEHDAKVDDVRANIDKTIGTEP
jgi:hypothetical protein